MKILATSAALILLLSTPANAENAPTAQRFDSIVRVQPGGPLDVTETFLVRFEDGRFDEFTRQLVTRHTDGIQVLDLWMDGRRSTIGDGPGQVRMSGGSRLNIRWRFPPTSAGTHTFAVHYLAHGAVRQDDRGDLLVWRTPVDQHRWDVQTGTVTFELPEGVNAKASVATRRTETAETITTPRGVRVHAERIGAHGWTDTTLVMPAGAILSTPPRWQVAERRHAAHATAWLTAGAFVFAAALIVLFGVRQGYHSPMHALDATTGGPAVPDSLAPALAGALVANGRASLEHAAASLLHLAERGAIRVEALPRRLGTRRYLLTRSGVSQALAPTEATALDAVFGATSNSITLSKARQRLVRRFRRFTRAVREELHAAGLLDRDREATRRLFGRLAGAMMVTAVLTFAAWPLLMREYGAWPLAIPAALSAGAIGGLLLYITATPLSNDGLRRAHLWRAYKDYLKSAVKQKGEGASVVSDTTLPYAVAFGLAGEWSKYFKHHPSPPAWFHARDDRAAGYAAFVAAAGAGMQRHAH